MGMMRMILLMVGIKRKTLLVMGLMKFGVLRIKLLENLNAGGGGSGTLKNGPACGDENTACTVDPIDDLIVDPRLPKIVSAPIIGYARYGLRCRRHWS